VASVINVAGAFVNAGTIILDPVGFFEIRDSAAPGAGQFTHTGQFDIGDLSFLTFNGVEVVIDAETSLPFFTSFKNVSLILNETLSLAGQHVLRDTSVSGQADLNIEVLVTVVGNVRIDTPTENRGDLGLGGDADDFVGPGTLRIGSEFKNLGRIFLDGVGAQSSNLILESGATLTNAATGTIVTSDTPGVLTVNSGATLILENSTIGVAVSNSGVVAGEGTFSANFTNDGTV
jgi:hypothetical protein